MNKKIGKKVIARIECSKIFDKLPQCVVVYEVKNREKDVVIKYLNKPAAKLEQVDVTKVVGKKVDKVFHGVKEFGLYEVFVNVWKTGKSQLFPISFYKDEYHKGWRENYVFKLSSDEVVAIYTDQTKVKQYEYDLKEKTDFTDLMMKLNTDVVYVYDLVDKKNVYVNEGIKSILGYSIEDVKRMGNKLLVKLMHPDDMEFYLKNTISKYANAKDGELIKSFYRMINKKGEWIWLSCSEQIYKRNKDGSPKQIFGVIHDINESKKLEIKLRESEEKYRKLFEDSIAPTAIIDIDSRWVKVNEAVCKLFGYSEKEMVGHFTSEFTVKEDIAKTVKFKKELIKGTNKSGILQKRYLNKKGEIIWANLSASLIHDESGNPLYFVIVINDISDIKNSSERMKVILENTQVGIAITDNKNIITYSNPKFAKIMGYNNEELLGKTFKDLTLAEDIKDSIKKLHQIQTGKIDNFTIEKRYQKKNKDVIFALTNVVAVREEDGEIKYTVVSVEDITDRKKKEDLLKENEERFRLLFENSAAGMSIVALDGRWLRVNKSLCNITGYSEKELLSRRYSDITFPDDLKKSRDFTAKIISEKLNNGYLEKRYIRGDGNVIWVSLNVSVMKNQKGRPEFFEVITEDITERVKLGDSKDAFLSLASHQLRTPLSSVKWTLDTLMENMEGFTARQQSKLNDLKISNEKLIKLVNYLLNVTKIESGKLPINKKPTDFLELLNKIIKGERIINKKKIEIIAPHNFGLVNCDPLLIGEVLENLITNAVNYSPIESDKITISILEQKNDFLITVHNDGFISEPTLSKIKKFEKFVRGERAKEISPSGSGLGLYISQKIIELGGGVIWVESNAKKGTSFNFTINK